LGAEGARWDEAPADADVAAGADFASPGLSVRRFTFSTTTALLRPWLKLWRTMPDSVERFSVSVFGEVSVLSPEFFVSVMPCPFHAGRAPASYQLEPASIAGPVPSS
jgi:hypothetical protein